MAGRIAQREPDRLPPVGAVHLPVRLAGLGHLRGGLALAGALRRAWPPATAILAVVSRRSRPAWPPPSSCPVCSTGSSGGPASTPPDS
ncbi:MAG: hypothetical protein AB1679_35660 [Actinomycetota bacterium]